MKIKIRMFLLKLLIGKYNYKILSLMLNDYASYLCTEMVASYDIDYKENIMIIFCGVIRMIKLLCMEPPSRIKEVYGTNENGELNMSNIVKMMGR